MSAPGDHETNCREALDRVYEYLDGEMTVDDTVKIKHHLDACGPCLKQYDLDQALIAFTVPHFGRYLRTTG